MPANETRQPKDYATSVLSFSRLSSSDSLYPGHHYQSLARFLNDSRESDEEPSYNSSNTFVHAAVLDLSQAKNENGLTQFSLSNSPALLKAHPPPKSGSGHIVSVRGYSSSQWLCTVGLKYHIDPAFYLKHLDFGTNGGFHDHFHLPGIPSAEQNISRLRITTIGARIRGSSGANTIPLERIREQARYSMKIYHRQMPISAQLGDSIVRGYSVYNAGQFAIEQDISICVNNAGSGWSAFLWSDVGKPLTEGVQGPWSSDVGNRRRWETYFVPIVQHLPRIALKSYLLPAPLATNNNASMSLSQSASLIHEQYATLLDPALDPTTDVNLYKVDAFYALKKLFTFAASSESQFLNFLQKQVDQEWESLFTITQHNSFGSLQYVKQIVDEHVQLIQENIVTIQNRGGPRWPRCQEPSQREKTDHAALELQRDFECLRDRAQRLSARCSEGMQIVMNYAMLTESRKGIEQASGVARLTFLAYLFLPISFTTSFFGMNFVQFGQGKLSIWIWLVVSAPIFFFFLILGLWNNGATVSS